MSLYKNKYRIESARLPGWDYSKPGYYFITVCTHDRSNLFGEIIADNMERNDFGQIVFEEWDKSFKIRRELVQDEFVVMPNHFHGIVRLVNVVQTHGAPLPVETHGRASLPSPGRASLPSPGRASLPSPGRASLPLPNRATNTGIQIRKPKSISSFMAGVKSSITKRINIARHTPGAPVLQFRFHDHIIRDENELFRIRQYIRNNPANWKKDTFNSDTVNSVRENSPDYETEEWMIVT